MANNKTGFNYYSTDTDRYQDIKIKRLKKDFGCPGMCVYDYLLCEIYRVKGCFLVWDDSTAFDVANYFGLKETLVNEIVNYCCNVGIFNKSLLASERVLTSLSIQKRYLDWSKKAKRTNFDIPEKVLIIQEESNIIQEECTQTSRSLPRSKVKESKETTSSKVSEDSGTSKIVAIVADLPKTPFEIISGKVEAFQDQDQKIKPSEQKVIDDPKEAQKEQSRVFGREMWKDQGLIDLVCMKNHIEIDDYRTHLEIFVKEVVTLEKFSNTYPDAKIHFMNWVRKQLEGDSSKVQMVPQNQIPKEYRMQKV